MPKIKAAPTAPEDPRPSSARAQDPPPAPQPAAEPPPTAPAEDPPTPSLSGMADRIAAGLEGHFLYCTQAAKTCMELAERDEYYTPSANRLVDFLKTSAQIGGVIARLESLRNRNSIPQ